MKGQADPQTNLAQTQALFAKCITNPLSNEQRMKSTTADGSSITEIAESIVAPNDRLSSFERLEIYNRQYWFRLIDCLFDDFPGLLEIMGEEKFYAMAVAYLTKFGSGSFSLRNLGRHLVQFLEEEPIWIKRSPKAAVQMARFEWAQIEAFDGPSLPLLDVATLAAVDPAKAQLHLQPYLTLLELDYPLDEFVIALRKEKTGRSEASAEWSPKTSGKKTLRIPKAKKTFLVVHRFQNSLYYKRLEKPAFILLSQLQSGQPLAAACAEAANYLPKSEKTPEKVAEKIKSWFAEWALLGWFCQASA